MQLIFHGPVLAAAAVQPIHPRFSEFLQREEIRHLTTFFLVVGVCGLISWVLSLWAASKALADKEVATLLNALKVWILGLLVGIGLVVGLSVGIPAVAAKGDQWRVLLVSGGGIFLGVMLNFLIPMKTYVIGFFRTLGLLLLAACINGGAMFAVEIVLIKSMKLEKDVANLQASIGKTPAEQRRFGERLAGREAPDEIDRLLDDALLPIGPRPPLPDRERMVLNLQQKLNARQHTLNPSDTRSLADYKSQLNRYMTFRNEVIAERRTTPTAGAH